MELRPIEGKDREPLAALIRRVEAFTPSEQACALELVDLALTPNNPDYLVRVAAAPDGQLLGYVCYGPTPMTDGTWDLYWIATDPAARGQGVGARLTRAMEDDLRRRGGRRVRVETSASEAYGATRGFYAATQYVEEARFRNFYREGEDLVILAKHL